MSMTRDAAAQTRIDNLLAAARAHEGNASRDRDNLVKLLQTGWAFESELAQAVFANASAEEAEARTLRAQAEALIEAA
jgi:hypothetical protein